MDRLLHAITCCKSALRDGLQDASPMVTEPSEESERGKTHYMAKGGR